MPGTARLHTGKADRRIDLPLQGTNEGKIFLLKLASERRRNQMTDSTTGNLFKSVAERVRHLNRYRVVQ